MPENPSHEENLKALRRIEGQVRGIQKMIQDRKYCVDILTQLYAIRGALARVEDRIIEKHLSTCVTETFMNARQEEKKQKLDEVIKLIRQIRR